MTKSAESIGKPETPLFVANRKITCVMPDNGTDQLLIQSLRTEKGILTATSTSCRGISMVRQSLTRQGNLPESELVRVVDIIAPDDNIYELFNYIYELVGIGKPGGGTMWIGSAINATPYSLPDNVPDEAS